MRLVASFPSACSDEQAGCAALRAALLQSCESGKNDDACRSLLDGTMTWVAKYGTGPAFLRTEVEDVCGRRSEVCDSHFQGIFSACASQGQACSEAAFVGGIRCEQGSMAGCAEAAKASEIGGDLQSARQFYEMVCDGGAEFGCSAAERLALQLYDRNDVCGSKRGAKVLLAACATSRAAAVATGGTQRFVWVSSIPDDVAAEIQLSYDDFDDVWGLFAVAELSSWSHDCSICTDMLVAPGWRGSAGGGRAALLIGFGASDWYFVESLTIEVDGEKLSFSDSDVTFDREVRASGDVSETVGVELSVELLTAIADAKLVRFRLRGRAGTITGSFERSTQRIIHGVAVRAAELERRLGVP